MAQLMLLLVLSESQRRMPYRTPLSDCPHAHHNSHISAHPSCSSFVMPIKSPLTSGTISQMFPTHLVFGVSEGASFKKRGAKGSPKPQSPETSDTVFRCPWVVSFILDSCLPCLLPSPAGHKTGSQCYWSTGGPFWKNCFLLVNKMESMSGLDRDLTLQATKYMS